MVEQNPSIPLNFIAVIYFQTVLNLTVFGLHKFPLFPAVEFLLELLQLYNSCNVSDSICNEKSCVLRRDSISVFTFFLSFSLVNVNRQNNFPRSR